MRIKYGGFLEECEICGRKSADIYITDVEGVELRVCTKCAKGKKIVSRVAESRPDPKRQMREKKPDYEQLVENYGTVIRSARERMKIPIKVLAEMLNEKETLLPRIEQQKTMPSEELRKKLEKALGIRLADLSGGTESEQRSYGNRENVTLGDFVIKK